MMLFSVLYQSMDERLLSRGLLGPPQNVLDTGLQSLLVEQRDLILELQRNILSWKNVMSLTGWILVMH